MISKITLNKDTARKIIGKLFPEKTIHGRRSREGRKTDKGKKSPDLVDIPLEIIKMALKETSGIYAELMKGLIGQEMYSNE